VTISTTDGEGTFSVWPGRTAAQRAVRYWRGIALSKQNLHLFQVFATLNCKCVKQISPTKKRPF
jgi:hypothetical protein